MSQSTDNASPQPRPFRTPTTLEQASTTPGALPRSRPWRLSPRLRKLLLLTHIAAGGAWLGIDVVLGVLVVTALTAGANAGVGTGTGAGAGGSTVGTPGSTTAAALSLGIAAFATWPIIVVGSLSLITGVVLGIGSKYGLVRTTWVLVKLLLNVVLLALVVVVLVPGILELGSDASAALDESAGRAAGGAAGGTAGGPFTISGQLLFPPIVSSTALVFAMTLSVFKPWGRKRLASPSR